MSFDYPNIYFLNGQFWMRCTLVAFIFINVLLASYVIIKKCCAKSTSVIIKTRSENSTGKGILLPVLVYLSTIPVYFFREAIADGGESAIHKVAEYLNNIESLVVIILIVAIIYGFKYKNSYTFINLYFRALAILEITYITAYYITNQTSLEQWYNCLGVLPLGAIFVALSRITIKLAKENTPQKNIHNAICSYESLFSNRKNQADEIVNIIESDASESGYSICVTGEWGAGKTSLLNGAYNKAKLNGNLNLYEIRINALELDDSVSLINYFFKRIEGILKTNGIYTGIASEYKELIASISGTVISESVTNFATKKLNSGNSDYRGNLNKLSELLFNNLEKSRILIIVDDIERCSSDKAKSYLFLIKEIATMNRCITVFLADIDELKNTCNLKEAFFEKFFNHIINLTTVESDEILSSLTKISDKTADLSAEIIQIVKKFDDEIDKTEKEPFLYIQDREERQRYKEERISSITKDKEQFTTDLANPRRVGKIFEYYLGLIEKVHDQFGQADEKMPDVDSYLNKIDYKKQISLLSMIYGLYSSEFAWIQSEGIYNYIRTLASRLKSAESQDEKIHRVDAILGGEWYHYMRTLSNDFIIQEKLRFVNCLLTEIGELANISNGYTSYEEKCISTISKGTMPGNIPFSDLVEIIYTATHNELPERKKYIEKVFDLYVGEMETDSVGVAFELFSHDVARNFFSGETPVLQMFAKVFCTDSRHLVAPTKIKKRFISFANGYLWRNCATFSRYFMPISSLARVSLESWNNASEAILSHDTCESMLTAYCEKCESFLDFTENVASADSIKRLQNLIDKVDAEYRKLASTECYDVLQLRKNVAGLMEEIKSLLEIERFIDKYIEIAERSSFNVRTLSTDTLIREIDKLYNELDEELEHERKKDIQGLLQFVCSNVGGITYEGYEKLNTIVENYCIAYYPVPSWRQMLVYIKKNIDDNEDSTHDCTEN